MAESFPKPVNKKRINSQAKGKRGENSFINAWCALIDVVRGPHHRRNCQATAWGGASNQDVNLKELPCGFFEVKHTEKYMFHQWIKKLREECPPNKVPVLAYREQGKADYFWLNIPMEKLEKFCCEVVEAFGYTLSRD